MPRLLSRTGLSADAASLAATTLAYAPRLPAMLATIRLIDSLGRRTLLLVFLPAMALSHLGLAGALSAMGGATNVAPAAAAVAAICG